ncbi:calcium-responsive transactivator-like isoform X7 [Cyprinus carpio]|uniref:Calcium-responsive transactivator-like isoform X7 n=1 Tax=Cyprinus carpio TaxID=7962 RepID=A0A9Q9XQF3_CYPCA|nr:calcium-responsive transactivator-like isoform X7 [Cyprinus carpio]
MTYSMVNPQQRYGQHRPNRDEQIIPRETGGAVRPRGKGEVTQQTIQKMLDENHHLIQCIMDYQSKGKTSECTQYQQILHRNLVYLATIADSNQNMQSLLPAPPNPNLNIGPGGGGQSLHSRTNMNDSMGTGLPPTLLMQSQMSNVSMMHQQGTGPHYSSTSAGDQHYQGQQTGIMAQGNQGNIIMSQRPLGSYCVPQQGSAPQYMGQEEFYGEQYGHTQSSSEPVSQQYYSDGHGDYSYQQSSYEEQNYERSFDESSQHYYEGGNSQYSQQQTQYQQGSGTHQTFSQQQYPSQAGYSAQPQGYGAGQGSSSQYPQYQQGQNQQYPSYRSIQPGPAAPSQRSYSFEQGQYGNYQQ